MGRPMDRARQREIQDVVKGWATARLDEAGIPTNPTVSASPLIDVTADAEPVEIWEVGVDIHLPDSAQGDDTTAKLHDAFSGASEPVALETARQYGQIRWDGHHEPLRESEDPNLPWIQGVGLTLRVLSPFPE